MKRFLIWLKERLISKGKSDSMLANLVRMLAATKDKELSCDDVYAMLEQFTEAILRGAPVTGLMASIEQHLEVCPDCRDEYEALLKMMQPA